MSKAEPVPLKARLKRYLSLDREVDGYVDRESDLTPAQRRRSGERGHGSEVLYGRKGHATPRQRKPRRDG